MNETIKWLCFHGCYDFAYFYRTLQNEPLPNTYGDYERKMDWYFRNSIDIKLILADVPSLDSGQGLNKLAEVFEVGRVGTAHQAGSDSLVTLDLFFKMINSIHLNRNIKHIFS